DAEALRYAVRRSCELKAQIVGEDEREHGRRALLNLGHTFGHALETIGGYERWLHGEAVAIGTQLAAHTSRALGWLGNDACVRIESLLRLAGRPVCAPDVDARDVLLHMARDKKADRHGMKLVLLERIGRGVLERGPDEALLLDVIR